MGSVGARRFSIQDKASLYKATDKLAETYWQVKTFGQSFVVDDTKKEYREIANNVISYFEENNQSIITPSADYDDEIVWQFSGKDKVSGRHASFEFDSGLNKNNAVENLRGNGYTAGVVLPKNLFTYAVNRTNMTPEDLKILNAIATQALKEYRNRRK